MLKTSTTLRSRLSQAVPFDLQPELEITLYRENALRLIIGFAVGAITHVLQCWVGWQRMHTGVFEQEPAYRWIFFNQVVWWLCSWIPIEFISSFSSIKSGHYPPLRLKRLVDFGIFWAWAFTLMNAVVHFHINPALGFFACTLLVLCLFLIPLKKMCRLLLVSAISMAIAIWRTDGLTVLEKQYWTISVVALALVTLLFATLWYNMVVRQFLNEKQLETQKHLITEQANLLSEKNQIIEEDKANLSLQLETANTKLNTFTLRLAQKRELFDEIKNVLGSLASPNEEGALKKNRLISRIKQELEGENDWDQFKEQFELVNPRFFSNVLAQHPSLNPNELRLLALVKMNLDSQSIAALLHISPQSVNTARYRLKKRLELAEEIDLLTFVRQF